MRKSNLLLRQIIRLILLLLTVSTLTFILVNFSPIDPVQAYIGADMLRVSEEQRLAITEHWGLSDPPIQRYMTWLTSLIQGDFGTSMIYREPVLDVIKHKFMSSFALLVAAWLLSGLIGFVAGIVAAVKEGSWIDRCIKSYCYVLSSTPAFWAGLVLLLLFTVWLPIFPVGLGVPIGMEAHQVSIWDTIYHMILPVITLSLTGISAITLHTREKLIEVMKSDYILFARARGEEGLKLVGRHGLRNILLPAITLQFASFSELFGGAVLIEQVFSYPGLGKATVEASTRGDLPLLMGIVICSALFVFLGHVIAEWIYRIVDPRIKEGDFLEK